MTLPLFIADTDASAIDHIDKGPFVPSILQPAQYADMHRGRLDTGEMRLCEALLEDAIRCLSDGNIYCPGGVSTRTANRQRLRDESLRWINGDDAPLTFEMVCGAFQVDQDAAREWLLRRYAAGEIHYTRKAPIITKPPIMGANPDPRKQRKRAQDRWRTRKSRRAL